MAKIDKLVVRFKNNPKDFTWEELYKLLSSFGFKEFSGGKTGGSRRKFYHQKKDIIIYLHKPHPQPILKGYAVKQVKELLEQEGII